ncbi:MAG: hypothetical protein OXH27_01035, partial [Gammaproteobacteria bacterium]|nr:hypothetical protein [Gammaproteobacteria bacterium]
MSSPCSFPTLQPKLCGIRPRGAKKGETRSAKPTKSTAFRESNDPTWMSGLGPIEVEHLRQGWHEQPIRIPQKIPRRLFGVPSESFFVDPVVADDAIGKFDGKRLDAFFLD